MFNNHAGINLTETKLQLVEINYKNNSFFLENVDQIFHAESFTPILAEEKLINILQQSYNKISSRKPLTTQNVSFALPNNFFKIFEVPYDDSLVKKDLIDHFKWEISVLYPNSEKDDFFIQHIEVDKSNIRKEKRAIIFAIERNHVIALNKFCKQNKLRLKYIDNVHLASNAFLYLDKQRIIDEISLSIYIDQKYSSVSVLEGVYPFYFKPLNPDPVNIFDELLLASNKLEELNLSLSDFKEILLYGQDITEEFENKLKSFFGLPLKKVDPFEKLKIEEVLSDNPFYKIKFNSFTAAAGIAIRII